MMKNPKSEIPPMNIGAKSIKSITLLELLISVSILTLLILVGGGIYLSGWNMFREAQFLAQSHRNAVIPMAHMVKHLQEAISFTSVPGPPLELRFTVDPLGTPTTERYIFNDADNEIQYDDNTTQQIIGRHVNSAEFTVNDNDIVVTIEITAGDNNDENPYTITSTVEARYGATPPV